MATSSWRVQYPEELEAAERALIESRRSNCSQRLKPDQIGLGLSGGGIRSATFALGILQSLARGKDGKPSGEKLERIDYLSTVSGGGYIGSFLGRLYSRNWIKQAADAAQPAAKPPEEVAKVLRGAPDGPMGSQVFRYLRDNGRYLAPRGGGDLLTMIGITLRNWFAVQMALIILALTIAVAMQSFGQVLQQTGVLGKLWSWHGTGIMLWSRWILLLAPITLLWTIPAGWAFWVMGQPLSAPEPWRRSDLLILILAGGWLIVPTVSGWRWLPDWLTTMLEQIPELQGMETKIAIAVAAAAFATTVFTVISNFRGVFNWIGLALNIINPAAALSDTNTARSRLTRWFKVALVATAVVAGFALIDSVAASTYAIVATQGLDGLVAPLSAVGSLFVGVATFGRQLLVFLSGESAAKKKAPAVSVSILSWIAAVTILVIWLTLISTASYAIAWRGKAPDYAANVVVKTQSDAIDATKLVDAKKISIAPRPDGVIVEPVIKARPASKLFTADQAFTSFMLSVLVMLTWITGNVRTFLNLSSLNGFYSQRLTRAYLGASNERRHDHCQAHVTDPVEGDDIPADDYWCWPTMKKSSGWIREKLTSMATAVRRAFTDLGKHQPVLHTAAAHGGPLHIVNVTINETYDLRTRVQIQDRKGVPLAIGPAGFSVGVRHHLVAGSDGKVSALPGKSTGCSYAVFAEERLKDSPEPLTLGRWAGISGAAVSSAMGTNTSVPIAFLATFANVRLGYWWDSGLNRADRGAWQYLPVYSGLLSEARGHLEGTSGRLWNLSDGGHFENLAAYELIRRRLKLIIVIDAEADPDFEFPGLAELIRKARLDFGADIQFLEERPKPPHGLLDKPPYAYEEPDGNWIPNELSAGFTSLTKLRRCVSSKDEQQEHPTLAETSDRQSYSQGHAALAKVTYVDDPSRTSWLVYVKATVTGEEPVDVLQYHARHNDFPHESTADQFFDEAQWESYRRLGEFIGDEVLTPELFSFLVDESEAP